MILTQLLAFLCFTTPLQPIGSLKSESIALEIQLPYGDLQIEADADASYPITGNFFSKEDYQVQTLSKLNGDNESIRLTPPPMNHKDKSARWDLLLKKDFPFSVVITTSGGAQHLNLAELAIESFSLQSLGGPAHIDLSRSHPLLKKIELKKSSGITKIDLSGSYPLLESLDMRASIGRFSANCSGHFNSCQKVTLALAHSEGTLDLTGSWEQDFEAHVELNHSTLTLLLPKEVGVQVLPSTLETRVIAPQFSKKGGSKVPFSKKLPQYTNSSFGKSTTTLTIYLSGVGSTLTIR